MKSESLLKLNKEFLSEISSVSISIVENYFDRHKNECPIALSQKYHDRKINEYGLRVLFTQYRITE